MRRTLIILAVGILSILFVHQVYAAPPSTPPGLAKKSGAASSDADADARSRAAADASSRSRTDVYLDQSTGDSYTEAERYPDPGASQAYSPTPGAHQCDTSGAAVQTGSLGASLGTITEACRAYRMVEVTTQIQETAPWAARLVRIQYYAGFPIRFVLHVATGGVLH